MAMTVRLMRRARSSTVRRWSAPPPWASTRNSFWPTTTATPSSTAWAISSAPGRPTPMSTTSIYCSHSDLPQAQSSPEGFVADTSEVTGFAAANIATGEAMPVARLGHDPGSRGWSPSLSLPKGTGIAAADIARDEIDPEGDPVWSALGRVDGEHRVVGCVADDL